MARQSPSVPISLMLFLVSALLAYWVVSSHGWPATDLLIVWRGLSPILRAAVVACLIANAYGVGGLLNSVMRRGQEPSVRR